MKKFYYAAAFFCSLNFINAQVFETTTYAFMSDVSNNGVAVGNVMFGSHIMWTEQDGVITVGEPASGEQISGNTSISADGKYIAGTMTNPETMIDEMARYDVATGQWKYLGNLVHGQDASVWGMSSDGKTIVGLGFKSGWEAHGIKWTEAAGIVDLGSTHADSSSRANAINDDGSVIVGWQDDDFDRFGVYWKNGQQYHLKDANGEEVIGEIGGVSGDGKTMIGYNYDYPFIWNETDGYQEFPHEDPMYEGSAVAVSDDGKRMIGYYRPWGQGAFAGSAFIWTKEKGIVDLNEYVASLGIADNGMTFSLPLGMSPNGKYIVGIGKKNDDLLGFVIKLPDSALATNNVAVPKSVIYPNPVNDVLNISNADKLQSIEIYNFAGQKIMTSKSLTNNQINVSKLPKGSYILKLVKNGKEESVKFVKN
ncbi:T9SS type A sorting domain-containing protein [Soonwooa sp.]|uniref:T9SS type A sorting domain-containing protein n=1 Tax=Soonwooa sp. TaxID=1938592 RepID=UPI00260D389A|nr:T9SS type A sorting domain-containing protein [Soonwooa sp.]